MRNPALALALVSLAVADCERRVQHKPVPAVTEIKVGAADTSHLRRGFYESHGAWRWTAPSFAVSLDAPATREKVYVVMDCTIPTELMGTGEKVTLSTRVNGVKVGEDSYTAIGHYGIAHEIPSKLLRHTPLEVEFTLDRKATDGPNGEPRGLIALTIGVYDETRTPQFRDRIWTAGKEEYRRIYAGRTHGFTPEQDAELKRLFHDLRIWDNLQFLGVPILKNPLDLWLVQQVIYEVRPDFIVETGTYRGGSALFWAHTLEGMGLRESKVLTVDIGDYCQSAAAQSLWRRYVEFFRDSSTSETLVRKIASRVKGKKVIVALDSNHEAAHVLAELKAYGPMVSRGGYLIVEDTHLDGVPTQPEFGPGPFAATTEFLKTGAHRDFERDFSREGFGTSFNPGGWLRHK